VPADEKGDINNAHFSQTVGRTEFSDSTNPYCFVSDISPPYEWRVNIYIKNIRENPNGTLSFDIRFCERDDIMYSNTSNLPAKTNAFNIQTSDTVIIKNTDNVIFEAENEVIIEAGFEIESGGTFEINMKPCEQKK